VSTPGGSSGDRPDISIIVPTRNRAGWLPSSLASLTAQRCAAPLEFVIVDNGSEDETARVIDEWSLRDARVIPCSAAEPGRSSAMNVGASVARGSLLLFTDDDVVVDPAWAETYRAFFAARDDAGPPTLAGGPILPVADDLRPWPAWVVPDAWIDMGALDHGSVERPLGRYEHLWGANMAVRADVVRRLGPWDVTVGRRLDHRGTYEDVEYQDRVRAAGGVVWFCPGAVIRHRVDRATVTPRTVVERAFARGRNDAATGRPFAPLGPRGAPASDAPADRPWPRAVGAWAARTSRLRWGRDRRGVEAARSAAYRAGWAMERPRTSAEARAPAGAAWNSARILIRATPAVPGPPAPDDAAAPATNAADPPVRGT
jgi:glycosyltransferase involved in cell wall biosynthesis